MIFQIIDWINYTKLLLQKENKFRYNIILRLKQQQQTKKEEKKTEERIRGVNLDHFFIRARVREESKH